MNRPNTIFEPWIVSVDGKQRPRVQQRKGLPKCLADHILARLNCRWWRWTHVVDRRGQGTSEAMSMRTWMDYQKLYNTFIAFKLVPHDHSRYGRGSASINLVAQRSAVVLSALLPRFEISARNFLMRILRKFLWQKGWYLIWFGD